MVIFLIVIDIPKFQCFYNFCTCTDKRFSALPLFNDFFLEGESNFPYFVIPLFYHDATREILHILAKQLQEFLFN